jgi:hypothetical protein
MTASSRFRQFSFVVYAVLAAGLTFFMNFYARLVRPVWLLPVAAFLAFAGLCWLSGWDRIIDGRQKGNRAGLWVALLSGVALVVVAVASSGGPPTSTSAWRPDPELPDAPFLLGALLVAITGLGVGERLAAMGARRAVKARRRQTR